MKRRTWIGVIVAIVAAGLAWWVWSPTALFDWRVPVASTHLDEGSHVEKDTQSVSTLEASHRDDVGVDQRRSEQSSVARASATSIEVLVVDTTGRAMGGLGVVVARQIGHTLSEAHERNTAPDGHARFVLSPGRYRVQSQLSDRAEWVDLEPDETEHVVFTIGSSSALAVRVVDTNGTAIPSAQVWMSIPGDSRLGTWVGVTDASGTYSAKTNSGTWPCYFAAAKQGYATSWTYESKLLKDGAPIVLDREIHGLRGTVVDASDAPIAGALVRLWCREVMSQQTTPSGARLFSPPPQSFTTGMDGRFAFENERSRGSELFVECDGYATTVQKVTIYKEKELRIRLDRPTTIQGTVYAVDGQPANGAKVGILAASTLRIVTQCDASGRYRIHGVPPGSIQIAAILGEDRAQDVLEVTPATVRTWNARLESIVSVEGRVEGEEVRDGDLVQLQFRDGDESSRPVSWNGREFRFAPVRKAECRVLLLGSDGRLAGASVWVTAPASGVRVETRTLDKQITLRSAAPVAPGRFTLRYADYPRATQSWDSSGGAAVLLDAVRGRGPARLSYRADDQDELELATIVVNDERHQDVTLGRIVFGRGTRLVAVGTGDDWDTLRVVDETGHCLYERHVSQLKAGCFVPLACERGTIRVLKAGFVVMHESFDAVRVPESFDPRGRCDAVLVKVEARGALPKLPVALVLVDEAGVVVGRVRVELQKVNGTVYGIALVHRGGTYRWRVASGDEATGTNAELRPARWSGDNLVITF